MLFFKKITKIKMKSFECPKSIRNYEKKILGTSDAWLTSHLSHRPSEPAYYIVDCRISCFLRRPQKITKMKIKSFECPKSIRNYEKK